MNKQFSLINCGGHNLNKCANLYLMTVLKALMQSPQILALVINFSLTFAVDLMGEYQVYVCFV